MGTPFQKHPQARSNYTTTFSNYIEDFRHAIISSGLMPPDRVVDDGAMHRFSSNGKRGDDAGWYIIYGDGVPAGSFGCWRLGLTQGWCSKSPGTMTPAERESHRKRVETMKLEREAETKRRHAFAAKLAKKIWDDAKPADAEHPYLVRKNVHQNGLRHMDDDLISRHRGSDYSLRYRRDALIAPLYNDGELANLQFIMPDGEKRFLAGGQIKGSHSPVGTPQDGARIYICEGWATGATIHQHTGCAVYCAMNAGNLLDVGRYLRERSSDAEIIFAGDDDRLTKDNPGRTAALLAASTLNCKVVFPQFPSDAPMELSDFNDLKNWGGVQ